MNPYGDRIKPHQTLTPGHNYTLMDTYPLVIYPLGHIPPRIHTPEHIPPGHIPPTHPHNLKSLFWLMH